ncbi:uncharacterized protein ATC70_007670 [Mucor velutinosus]|uniref:tRNA (uracil-O(2)-)-methyltransferase n=1 Tax=Mucor velutinosus TaxID=708070 RepID=A0AAN7D368_9FUNG|nr:hypothetical protein ATC70_007670 [Mucor velutinosus]
MSKQQGKISNESNAAVVADPQSLFQQFAPTLYFEKPKSSLRTDWYVIAVQVVPATRDAFWETIRRWTLEPQFVIPPIEKAEIKSSGSESNHDHDHDSASDTPMDTIIRELIPKRKSKDANLAEKVEYFESDKEARVIYEPLESKLPFYYPKVKAYSFVYELGSSDTFEQNDDEEQGTLRLEIIPLDTLQPSVADPKMQYALKTILHKLFKWCIQKRLGYKKKAHHDVLVPKDTYQSMYQYIKAKYGPHLVANWTEKTDPKKFVYEDLAIASYLLCIWKEEEKKTKRKQTFIDLGCGNGLLTFLLSSEGYEGYGIDIADRRIWPALSEINGHKKDILRVEALYPAKVTYPGTEWLIGNHADELVPWIPIIASKSGDNCKFMVIPCCFYGLDGTRSLSLPLSETVGKYRAYTDYIKDIAVKAGFHVEEDYLRIPSTKNIAIIGRTRQQHQGAVDLSQSIDRASQAFVPRKTDREKEEERQESLKKPKLEK